jgi:hypothetical protein
MCAYLWSVYLHASLQDLLHNRPERDVRIVKTKTRFVQELQAQFETNRQIFDSVELQNYLKR